MMVEMRDRCVQLWNEEYYLSTTWNYQAKPYHDEYRYIAQENLTEVLDQARACAQKKSLKANSSLYVYIYICGSHR